MKPILNTERLKEKREEKGWSRNVASQQMGLLQSAYSRYESGQRIPSYSVLKIMALTLGTSVEYLTGQTNIDAPSNYVVNTSDPRIGFIFESYNSFDDDDKERLFQYTKKICAQTQISKKNQAP